MSEEHGDDMNFNELVGSLLSSHNADKGSSDGDIEHDNNPDDNQKPLTDKEESGGTIIEDSNAHHVVELPDFRSETNEDEEEDLAAVVASAIQNMDQEPQDEEVPTNDHFTQQEEGHSVENDEDHQQQQEWAQILQQGILNSIDTVRNTDNHIEEHLDQDDENLRRAILESLQELNTEDKVQIEKKQEEVVSEEREEKSKKSSKKSSKKKRKDKPGKSKDHAKEKSVSSKKKHSKDHKKDRNDDNQNLLNFEDVIKGFMQHEGEPPQTEGHQAAEVGDAETQALVEATLKAFERELLGPSGNVASSSHHHKSSLKKKMPTPTSSSSSSKKKSKSKRPDSEPKSVANNSIVKPRASTSTSAPPATSKSKKKKSAKTIEKSQETYEEDEFSRALAEMVNQVVNTSLTEPSIQSTGATETQQDVPSPSSSTVTSFTGVEQPSIPTEQGEDNDETFDLNQIMQKAMAMAFQEQTQEGLETSVMEEFNRGLGDLSVSELLAPGAVPSKQKKVEKSANKKQLPKKGKIKDVNEKGTEIYEDGHVPLMTASKKKKLLKAEPSLEEIMRKKYSQIAMAAASAARKRMIEKNKEAKFKVRSERRKARDERRLRKKEEKDRLELERKELEEIVSRGHPYPPDLRLTKSGKPKKPYRRWTQEELEKRASMPPEELGKPREAKKPRKKKSKKLKKIPLSSLKKIPLFNFIRGNVPSAIGQKLNGIEDTLTKIPLQTYRVDINKLAPPNTVTPEEMEKNSSVKEEDTYRQQAGRSNPFAFDAARKTVIRREKIPLHPPWVIPRHPPYALAVARRRRKEKFKKTKDYILSSKKRRQSKEARASLVFNAKSKIVPAILFPIINTLKAAARAKAASGASSEEASKHLMTIIKHTKKSIAQTLALARMHSIKDYSAIKTERDFNELQDKEQSIKRIPIFTLAKIREIDIGGEVSSAHQLSKHQENTNSSIIKIEDEETSNMLAPAIDKQPEVRDGEKAVKNLSGNIEEVTPNMNAIVNISAEDDKQNEEDNTSEKVQNEMNSSKNQSAENEPDTSLSNERMSSEKQSQLTLPILINEEAARGSDLQLPNFKSEGGIGLDINKEVEFLRPVIADQNDVNGKEEVRNILEKLVKQQLTNSHGGNIDLPTNLSNIISSTIGELIPGIEEENEEDYEEETGDYPKRKRHRKGPPPVLNLDGLVPPNNQRFIPKIEEKPQYVPHIGTNVRKPRKKVEQTALQYTFNIPNYKDMQGKRTMLLKRAKEHLTNDEMNILKKEINKERKRKWREANVDKNWEHDLRARLKKRANIKFSEADSADKTKWFEEEIARNLAERGIKQNKDATPDENINGKKNAGFTNLTDNEVLNMIASTLRKLDVARLLERELNEDASSLVDHKRKKVIKSQQDTPHMLTVGRVEERTLEVTVPSYHAQEMTTEETDEIDETGGIKRPYPDDISVTIPILKRPRFLSTEEKK